MTAPQGVTHLSPTQSKSHAKQQTSQRQGGQDSDDGIRVQRHDVSRRADMLRGDD